jgi:hypothetical protein
MTSQKSQSEPNGTGVGFSWPKNETSPIPTGDVEGSKDDAVGTMGQNTAKVPCHLSKTYQKENKSISRMLKDFVYFHRILQICI